MVLSVEFSVETDFFEESVIHFAIPKTEKEMANNDRITKLIPKGWATIANNMSNTLAAARILVIFR